ncbi:hypothetical protein K3495_g15261, partial [Podosphaera aphanis]
MKTKDQAITELRRLKLREERQTGKLLKSARSDNAPELKNVMVQWQNEDGVIAEFTAIASSHQNGPAERSIQTAEMAMRTMIDDAELPIEFWDEAVEYDSYIRNRLPLGPTINGKLTSPIEAYTGVRPNVDHIRPWGYKAYGYVNPKTLEPKGRHDKLVVRGREGIFMGFSENTEKHAKIYAPDLGRVERVNAFLIDEKVKGGTIDLKLKNTLTGNQGTSNHLPQRKKRGRPRKDHESTENEADCVEEIMLDIAPAPAPAPAPASASTLNLSSEKSQLNLDLNDPVSTNTRKSKQIEVTPAKREVRKKSTLCKKKSKKEHDATKIDKDILNQGITEENEQERIDDVQMSKDNDMETDKEMKMEDEDEDEDEDGNNNDNDNDNDHDHDHEIELRNQMKYENEKHSGNKTEEKNKANQQ